MPTSRRAFVSLMAVSGTAGSALLSACLSDGQPTTDADAGNVSAIPVGTLRAIAGNPVMIGRDAGGLYAMTTLCSHAQCDLKSQGTISASGISCACHGSKFDANGLVTGGPASTTLPHFVVTLSATGVVTIHQGQPASASARTAVPVT